MAKAAEVEIELGDYVTIVSGQLDGFVGVLANVYCPAGILTYVIVSESDEDEFYSATKIALFKKA